MRRISIFMVRGGAAALIAVVVARDAGAQVVPAAPARAVVKDTVVRTVDGTRVALDSIRLLIRAFDTEPLSSMQSMKMARELQAMAAGFLVGRAAAGGPRIVITGPDGIAQAFGIIPNKGWIGLTTGGVHNDVDRPDAHFVQYLDYPPIVAVERHSPAQLAGIVPGDTLVAYDGVDVVAHPINVTQLLTPEHKIAVSVRREGETKAFTVVVGRMPNTMFTRRLQPGELPMFPAPEGALQPGDSGRVILGGGGKRIEIRRAVGNGPDEVFMFLSGVFGASLSSVGADFARAWKIEPGVLVNEVPEDTPAFRAGLKAGDVIVSVAGQPVSSVDDVRKLATLRSENHTVTLQVLRDKKTRTIIVK